MKAVVLAGGMGTRLHPLTINIPKPMVPVINRPLMEYILELLAKYKFTDIQVLLYHQPNIIKNHFGNGKEFGVKIEYVEAQKNFGTAGAVKYAAKDFNEPFIVISADLICDFNLREAVTFHKLKKSDFTVLLTRVSNPLPYGIVITGKDGRVKHFLEKPSWSEVFSDTINTGIYIIEPEVLQYIPEEKEFDFSQDLLPMLISKRKIYGYISKGIWHDIGSLEEYGRIHTLILAGGKFIKHKNAKISNLAKLEGIGYIGENTIIEDNATILNSIIGNNCKIGKGTKLREAVIWDEVEIGGDARIEKSVVGKGAIIGDRAYLEEHSVIADEVRVEKDATIRPFVKVWPGKIIEAGSVVTRSMVQRERFPKTLFGPFGVTGLCNVEITPEFAASLGAAYGAMLGEGSVITTSRDSHKASRMIYRALLSGVLSSGVNVSDLEMTPIPVARYELKALKSKGGFHVRKSPYDSEVIDIKFYDDSGMDLHSSKEKKVERYFFSEDFKRICVENVGELTFPFHRVAEQYKEGVLHRIDCGLIKNKKIKIVIDYACGSSSQIFPSIIGELGCEVVALNAYIDETKITKSSKQFEGALTQLSTIVKSLRADLGVMLDSGAEKIFICDEKGRIFSGDESLSIMASLFLMSAKKSTIAFPVNTSRTVEAIAKKYNSKVIKCKCSFRNMMETANNADFVGERQGGYIFPDFQPHFDGMFSIVKLIELLLKNGVSLSEIEMPKSFVVKRDISCLPEQKGKVVRTLAEELKEENIDMTDGIKINIGADWVLILPHPSRPVIELFVESEKNEKKLISEYTKIIDEIIR
ncbi:MAG: nucleotidyltransferase [Candidatus Saganbacteria bacterium]|uniref:Nucleotidyltransferase n=1 Tax=Candidatus Saganbacteria bacterium TaxID=2575572 RepID=A0A833NXW6_UNCSA|nr:MAG: nucleotidyltransferase [Candidatus Saganbacteria bacterium]